MNPNYEKESLSLKMQAFYKILKLIRQDFETDLGFTVKIVLDVGERELELRSVEG